jgi:hypothetical protein
MFLTAFILVLCAAFYWAGFRAAPHPLQYQSQAGFVVTLALSGIAGFFAWREFRTIADLAELIDPVPEITDVTYVPTATEVAAVSQALAAVPGKGRLGTTQEERRQLAERAGERRTDYWLIVTALSSDSVLAFYRERAPRRGWTVESDTPPWLTFSRDSGRLVLFVSDEYPGPGSKVLYAFSPPTY